jgi:hypothetical protein
LGAILEHDTPIVRFATRQIEIATTKVGWLLASENAAGVKANLLICVEKVGSRLLCVSGDRFNSVAAIAPIRTSRQFKSSDFWIIATGFQEFVAHPPGPHFLPTRYLFQVIFSVSSAINFPKSARGEQGP